MNAMDATVDSDKVHGELLGRGIRWEFNTPHASHFGGVWERLIRSVRGILEVTLGKQVVSDDCLVTLFCEAEAVINSRPISVVSMDSRDPAPLTPNMLLTLGDSPAVVGNFGEGDSYSRKRWRQVQYMSDQFWRRWMDGSPGGRGYRAPYGANNR